MIASLPSKIGLAFRGNARACRARKAASLAGCKARPPEALLKQLEEMGFRHVPELLRSRDP